jgi:predicted neutral ceramidase superfamily lipid hydrolase
VENSEKPHFLAFASVRIISRYNGFLLSHMPRYVPAQIIALQAVFVAFARYVFWQFFPLPFCLMRLPLFNQLQAYLAES